VEIVEKNRSHDWHPVCYLEKRIDEVTFETCPLSATGKSGRTSGYYSSVLAGVGNLEVSTAPSFAVASCNRGVFFGRGLINKDSQSSGIRHLDWIPASPEEPI
jgi:hypothetical protein